MLQSVGTNPRKSQNKLHISRPLEANTFRNPDIQQNYKDIFDILTFWHFQSFFIKKRNIFSELDINSEARSVEKVTVSVAPRTGRTPSLQIAPLPNRRYHFHKKKHESLRLDDYLFKVAQVRDSFHVLLF